MFCVYAKDWDGRFGRYSSSGRPYHVKSARDSALIRKLLNCLLEKINIASIVTIRIQLYYSMLYSPLKVVRSYELRHVAYAPASCSRNIAFRGYIGYRLPRARPATYKVPT